MTNLPIFLWVSGIMFAMGVAQRVSGSQEGGIGFKSYVGLAICWPIFLGYVWMGKTK